MASLTPEGVRKVLRKSRSRTGKNRLDLRATDLGFVVSFKGRIWRKSKNVSLTPAKLLQLANGQNIVIKDVEVGPYKGVVSWAGARLGPPYSESVELVMDDISGKVRRVIRERLPNSVASKRLNRNHSKDEIVSSLRTRRDGVLLVYKDAVIRGPDGKTVENDDWLTVPTNVDTSQGV